MEKNNSIKSRKFPMFLVMGIIALFLNLQTVYSDTLKLAEIRESAFIAQQQVSGKVIDENDMPLPGVTIVEKGTSNGAVTDMDGMYLLSVGSRAVLTISYMGYLAQEINVDDRSTIDIQMTQDAAELNEIVVIGYGQQKKVNLTGAVSTLDIGEGF